MLRLEQREGPLREPIHPLIQAANSGLRRFARQRPASINRTQWVPEADQGTSMADRLLSGMTPELKKLLGGGILCEGRILARAIKPTKGKIDKGNSAHPIAFAETELVTPEGRIKPTIIAIKAFDKPENAVREFLNTQEVHARGVDTIEPLYLIIDGSRAYLISKGRIGIKSLDTDAELSKTYKTSEKRELIRERLKNVTNSMLNLHINGVFHGDPQLKNFAVQPDGNVIPLDWEAARIFSSHYYEIPPEVIRTHATHDLEVLFQSLIRTREQFGIGLLSDARGAERWDMFHDLVFDSYMVSYLIALDRDSEKGINCDPYYDMVEQIEKDLIAYSKLRGRISIH